MVARVVARMVTRALKRTAAALALLPGAAAGAQTGAVRGVHDPAIAAADGVYWLFTTGRGIPIRRSRDLVHWDSAGRVFAEGVPSWARAAVPKVQFPWAPDISFFGGRWHLYYSLSSFASQRSAIALATNTTLDPAGAGYAWADQGAVVTSDKGSTYNAIDPNVVFDAQGAPWLAWGSFWSGIKLHRLDAATGKFSTVDTVTYAIASRVGTTVTDGPFDVEAVEAPSIVRHNGYFYLFASYDLCCRGAASTYNTRVGRAATITGPYVDRGGTALTAGGGTVVLAGSGRVAGPGGGSVLVDGSQSYLVHHFYDTQDNGTPTLQVRPIAWGTDDWPVVGDPVAPPPTVP